ncbi:unnamed protein product [Mytilus edulis]|uniref:SGNH hydrolase-type esterase domain-containing protein n=2 Tax=Mytilus TaxID=6548 RepID=A0A8S3TDF9_MYTED|nr:unnamed protein product [Mytilus edulis]
MDTESPNGNEGDALDRPRGDLLPLTPQPGPSGVMSPANNNLGMLTVSNVSHGSGSGSLDTRLQVDQSPSYISSVFDPISSHIPVKIKEKIWNGEFIDLNVLLKSTRDLVNEQNLEGELVVKGGVLSLVNQKKSPIKSIYVWTSAFMIYGSVMLEKWPNKGLEFFKYMQTVRMAASRGYSGGWVHYDEQFRLRKVFSPFSSWGVVDMELWLLCVSTPNVSPSFNTGISNGNNHQSHSGNSSTRDFNCPDIIWDTATAHGPDREIQQGLVEIAETYNLTQIHTIPTREGNLLDLVFVTNPTLVKSSNNVPGISDHDIIITDLETKVHHQKSLPRKCYIYKKAKWDQITTDLKHTLEEVKEKHHQGAEVHQLWDTFKSQLQKTMNTNIPNKEIRSRNNIPWIKHKQRKMLKKKQRLYKQARKTNKWSNYRSFQKECKKQLRKAEYEYVNQNIFEGLNNNDTKPFWKYIKSKRQDSGGIAPLKKGTNLVSDSYTHLYSLGNSPINVDEVKKALKNYPHQEVARDLIQGLEAGFKLKYSGPRLPMDIDSKEMNGEKATIARDKIFKEINLGSKAIWFVGSSIVYWAQTNAKTRYGGPNIGLQSRGVYIRWFGKRGMLWNDFNAKVSHAVDKFSPPAMIVIQLGSNDLVKVKTLELIQNIERDILRLHLLLPNTRIVWSEMLMRRYWHGATDGKAIERSRKRVNSAINNYALNDGHCVIQHPNIRAREMNLYRYDGTHLSDIGYDIYLNNIQGGIETFLSSQKIRRFPEV